MLALLVELAVVVLTLSGAGYLLAALLAMRSYARLEPAILAGNAPTISILKPVKGNDPDLYGAFASHCRQQYPGRYELLLGAAEDPAVLESFAARLRDEFPSVPVRMVSCPERLGSNGKVSTLVQMVPHALGEVLVINDADIRVGPGYLQQIAAALNTPGAGIATALYRAEAVPGGGLWSRLEALGVATDFLPGVLMARWMERGIRFGMGSTLALRRTTLEAIDGLEPLLDLLADDYELGARVTACGLGVALLPHAVATTVPPYSLRGFAEHQLRWMRTVRDARPLQYAALGITHPLPWALCTIVSSGGALWSFSLLSLVAVLRVAVALSGGVGILRDGQVLRDLLLLPLRDTVALLLWAWSYAGDEVTWRGDRFHVKDGRLLPLR